ncbi:MAG: hypothetical protein E7087_07585 [Bacteroidales bacterium]|nr:hypothetical protein [Bacteroidales bacterium]
MKKILLSILCLFSIIAVHADEVTFVAQGASTDATNKVTMATGNIPDVVFSSTNVELVLTKFNNNNSNVHANGHVRWYKSDILNIVPTGGATITKVVFATTGASYCVVPVANIGKATADTGTNTITWEGTATDTLKLAADNGQIRFTTMNVTYTLPVSGATLETPTASLEPGVFYNATSVELSASDGEIHYTLDGTEPTAESPVYSGAIAIENFGITTIKAIAIDGEEYSDIATFVYTLKVAAPKFNAESGVYEGLGYAYSTPILNIQTETTGAKIQYTWTNYAYNEEGDEETKNSYGTSVNLTIKGTTSVKATAFKVVDNDTVWSESVTNYYTISPIKPHQAATTIANGKYLIVANDTIVADHLYESKNYDYLYTKAFANETRTNGKGESAKFIEANEFFGYTFTETATAGEFTIQDAYGRYLYMNGSYNSFNVKADASELGDAAIWTITIDGDGVATIVNKEKNKTFAYSTQYESYGAYETLGSNHIKPVLYKAIGFPTLTFSPADEETVSKFTKLTVSCADGLVNNESDELYMYYNWNTDFEYNYDENMFNLGEQVDETSFTFEPLNEERGNKNYTINIPAGVFTLNPGGFYECTNEFMSISFTVEDNSILEITYANPADQANVGSISNLYFEFSQDIIANVSGAAITDDKGNTYPLSTSEFDAWGGEVQANAISFVTAEPITEPGTYTLVLKNEYFSTTSGASLGFDKTYTFTITEPFKVTSTTPAEGSTVESLSEIILQFNKQAIPMAEGFYVTNENGEGGIFSIDWEYAGENALRIYTDTPITAAGTYTLVIGDYNIYHMDMTTYEYEYLAPCTFTYTIGGSSLLGDVDGDGIVDVADATSVVGMILDNTTITTAGDVDGDGTVDVADVTVIVSVILGNDTASEAPAKAAATRAGATSTVSAEIENNEFFVNITNPTFAFSAIQFDIVLPEGIEVATEIADGEEYYAVDLGSRTNSRKHSVPECAIQPDGSLRVVIISMSLALYNGTEGDVAVASLKVDGLADGRYEYGIKNVTIANEKSEKEVLEAYTAELIVANGVTGIGSIDAEGTAADGAIYDLAGRKVNSTVKGGIYIQNGKKFIAE